MFQLDGIDIDYEDFDAMNSETGSAENWIIKYHNALRAELPLGRMCSALSGLCSTSFAAEYIISHAPVAPWFTTNTTIYPFGAYRAVHKAVGNTIDWYNVQVRS
jgi:chitinase